MGSHKAPFPWFGGKSRVADLVWRAFGDVPNYVEPFAGSLAVLLARPTAPRVETVNDLDCYLANFWRALQANPDGLVAACDWPVNEADLHTRHKWLVAQAEFRERMRADPDFYDIKIAGWWVWGLSAWIGSGWCSCARVSEQLPHLGNAGQGIHRTSGASGLHALATRLRRVRVACGDWTRVVGSSVTTSMQNREGMLTAVFLDPPYTDGNVEYAAGGRGVSDDVREWAIANGDNPLLRIALCGYEGEHVMPQSWRCLPWKAKGGYANQWVGENVNSRRERVWFSPHCLGEGSQLGLFGAEVSRG